MSDLITFLGGGGAGAYEAAVLEDDPLVYWRLGEASGTVAVDDSPNGNDGTYELAPTLGVDGLLVGDSDTAVAFDVTVDQRVELVSPLSAATLAAFSVECLADVPWADGPQTLGIATDDATAGLQLLYDAGLVFLSFFDAGDAQSYASSTVASGPHHVIGEWTGTAIHIYIDGHLVGDSGPLTDDGVVFASTFLVSAGGSTSAASADGTIDEFAFYTHALGPVRAKVHAFLAGYGDEPPTVTDVAPSSGPTAGGNTVVITGTNFTDATDVLFDGLSAESITVDSDTQITAVVPAHASGSGTVAVVTP